MIHVFAKIPPADYALIEKMYSFSSATLHEAMDRQGAMDCSIKPIKPGSKICGRAVTVKTHLGDNLMLHKALAMAEAGDIIVADTGMCTEAASWGDIMSVQAKYKGVSGLVLNGSVRDVAEIRAMDFPVYCAGVSIKGLMKDSLGTVNHPICCGSVTVYPGDIVVADDDGVVVIPLGSAEETIIKARQREEREADMIRSIRSGERMYDMLGFAEVFERLGCIEK